MTANEYQKLVTATTDVIQIAQCIQDNVDLQHANPGNTTVILNLISIARMAVDTVCEMTPTFNECIGG